jgi:polyribonucleotide nucleotidyltransferase
MKTLLLKLDTDDLEGGSAVKGNITMNNRNPIIGQDKVAVATIDNGRFGQRQVRFETGRLAQQASGAVTAYLDDKTMVLSTTTISSQPRESFDFFPLTVDVEERLYAIGRIPGSYFRREGRPTTEAVLACRIIDRPLRPLFDKRLRNEVQVIESILSVDPDDAYDVLAINAASASTMISGIQFAGPVSGTRLALIDGQWVAFPRYSELQRAVFQITVAGRIINPDDPNSDVAIAMIEAGATENAWNLIYNEGQPKPDETVVTQGLEAAKPHIKALCLAQLELQKVAAKEVQEFPLFPEYLESDYAQVEGFALGQLEDAYNIGEKQAREDRISEIKEQLLLSLAGNADDENNNAPLKGREIEIGNAFKSLQKNLVRRRILTNDYRIDGRALNEIRPLSAEINVLPRVHGSALFQRGETQILGATTLNTLKMMQEIDGLSPVKQIRYLHHYNFPPYSTGETGRVGSPKRREIGHGNLAERALVPVLPAKDEFPYAIRQVSEALSSNGSTSMGSVCASTLALLSAGVPIKASVAGIAMGLVSDVVDGETRYKTLTDILGAEDAFGDMDFKVAGTSEFITSIQLDTKLDGIPSDVLAGALQQAKDARFAILEVLNNAIAQPGEMAESAPRIISLSIPVDKIGEVIGPKGKVIQGIQEETGVEISIEDDGTVYIASENGSAAQTALEKIDAIAHPIVPEIGDKFDGKVVKIAAFGAFVNIAPNTDGLLHVTKMRALAGGKRIEVIEDVLKEGDIVRVKVAEIDNRGKFNLELTD